ncbi:PDZ domain-containing protein [Corynebacterium kroppenstedtii]|uniref:YlbL family protein n=1 Tax=Corynebacterium sp. PCR 32 TaxID=3351342 RepID=UPI0030B16C72
MNLRSKTMILGAIPVVASAVALSMTTIPGTSLDLSVPYAAEGPGPTFNTLGESAGKSVVEISGTRTYPTSGHLNMTTVSVRHGMSLPQAITRWATTHDTLVPLEQIFPSNQSPEEVNKHNAAQFASSESNATVAAMKYLHRPMAVTVISQPPGVDQIHKGDIIEAVDGQAIKQPGDLVTVIRRHKVGDQVTLRVTRDGRSDTVTVPVRKAESDNTPVLGITVKHVPADGTSINFHLDDIGGPSAGLMFTLAVIDKLTPDNLTNGKFIAGTGTIDANGDVGPIGGVTHKIDAAKKAGATMFMTPADNCAEALSGDHDGVMLAKVNTVDDAVTALKDVRAGKTPTTCS